MRRPVALSQFTAFVGKEFHHILRDRLTVFILVGLPILMLTLFGFAITTEVKNTRVAVFDLSHDDATHAITNRIAANPYFKFARTLSRPDQIDSVFRHNEAGLVVVFSEHFSEHLIHTQNAQIQFIADGTDPNTAQTLVQYATAIIATWAQEQTVSPLAPFTIVPNIKLLYNPGMKSAYNFVPGVMGMVLMLICAMMTSIAIAREKENGTMEVLLVSPMKPIVMILAKTVPYLALSIVNLASILTLSVFVLGVPIAGNIVVLIAISTIFIFVALALGLLISSIVETQLVALLISGMALMAPIMLLSGMMFPIDNMPWPLQWLSNLIPARWYIAAVKKVMIKGLGFESIIHEAIILSGMAIFFIAVSLKNFKTRLE